MIERVTGRLRRFYATQPPPDNGEDPPARAVRCPSRLCRQRMQPARDRAVFTCPGCGRQATAQEVASWDDVRPGTVSVHYDVDGYPA